MFDIVVFICYQLNEQSVTMDFIEGNVIVMQIVLLIKLLKIKMHPYYT